MLPGNAIDMPLDGDTQVLLNGKTQIALNGEIQMSQAGDIQVTLENGEALDGGCKIL